MSIIAAILATIVWIFLAFVFIFFVFLAIEYSDYRKQKKNDARQQADWLNARYQKLKK
jgi:uncharacterized membrane protein